MKSAPWIGKRTVPDFAAWFPPQGQPSVQLSSSFSLLRCSRSRRRRIFPASFLGSASTTINRFGAAYGAIADADQIGRASCRERV